MSRQGPPMPRPSYLAKLTAFLSTASYAPPPTISPALLTAAACVLFRSSIKSALCVPPPVLPPPTSKKPVLLFDYRRLLFHRPQSFIEFFSAPFWHQPRPFAREFLFNAVHRFELITVTDTNPVISEAPLKTIDPLNCIAYRLYLPDKREFNLKNLQRPLKQTVVLETTPGEFSSAFARNTLQISAEDSLKDVAYFLERLARDGTNDWRTTLTLYNKGGGVKLLKYKEDQKGTTRVKEELRREQEARAEKFRRALASEKALKKETQKKTGKIFEWALRFLVT